MADVQATRSDEILQLDEGNLEKMNADGDTLKFNELKSNKDENLRNNENDQQLVKVQMDVETIVIEAENSATSSSRHAKDYENWSERTMYQPPYSDSEEENSQVQFVSLKSDKDCVNNV